MIITSALMIWKGLIVITKSESPIVVVLSGSMEPGFARGDILFLNQPRGAVHTGDIVVYNTNHRDIPIVHRIIKVHHHSLDNTTDADILTKGDNNYGDDVSLYPRVKSSSCFKIPDNILISGALTPWGALARAMQLP
ncbi:hypothetical protein M9435_004759 [Picochlorum sp. BPE23]|nr:hypothetical protein M9435_004759 [Picochlorum sp. BPE23]